jgi:AraC-like DNA-binding protein
MAGYADQAHFTRECRSLLGETPSAWSRRRPCLAAALAKADAVSFKTPSHVQP